MNPIIWIDTETTGTIPGRHGIVQIAAIIEAEGKRLDEFSTYVRPVGSLIDEKAMETNGLTIEQLLKEPEPQEAGIKLLDFMGKYGSRFHKTQRLIPAGWNVRFDLDFIKALFDKWFDKYTFWWNLQYNPIDAQPHVINLHRIGKLGKKLSDYKLKTVCEAYGVPLGEEAHDALADVRATRLLTKHIYQF